MEEVIHATSGSMSVDELKLWNKNCEYLYAGSITHPEKVTAWSGWITAPTGWHMKQEMQLLANRNNVDIKFYNEQISGWIFKSTTFSFDVTGLKSHVDQFIYTYRAWKNRMMYKGI